MIQTQDSNVPELRFLGFEGNWADERLEDLTTRKSGHTPDKSRSIYWNGGIKWVSLADSFQLDNKYIFETSKEISAEGVANSSAVILPKGTVILSRDAGVGKSAIIASDMAVSQHFIAWLCEEKDLIFNEFLYYILQIKKEYFERQAVGSTVKTIGLPLFKKLRVNIPTLPEQRKIAGFLGAVDVKTAQLERKKALLEDYKKGCMQQLFSQEVRFKDDNGCDFPDWGEKLLSEVAHKTASTISANSLKNSPGKYPVYGASGIAGYVDYYSSDKPYISVVKDGAGVGRLFLCPAYSSVLGTLESIRAIDENDTKFIYYWMSLINFTAYATGSTIPHVYFKDYGRKRGLFPHPDEQRKIANFLSTLDAKIDLVGQEITHARTFKQGLLQQMFV